MHAGRRDADEQVALRDVLTRQEPAPLGRPHAEAREIVIAGRVHAGHFCRLAADQRRTRLPAAFRDAGDHPRGDLRIELAAGEIIEEEQRLGALHHHVVHAHRHEVDANRIVQARLGGDLDLGAHAVVGGDQDGIGKSRRFQIEKPAEAAKCRGCPRPGTRLGERLYSLHKRVAGIDVDARLRIGARWFCGHAACPGLSSGGEAKACSAMAHRLKRG